MKYGKIKGISLEFTPYGSTWFYSHYDDVLDMTPSKPQFNKSVKPVRKATDWDQYQRQHQRQSTERVMTRQEREAIFREFGA